MLGRRLNLQQRAERFYERRYAVSTAEHIYHEDLGTTTPASELGVTTWHDPSSWVAVRRALRRLRVEPDDVFADFGSGLGRAVIMASELPFRRVIGVELSPELTDRATANVEHSRARRRCGQVDLVTADVVTWPIPPDLTVAYFYSPFTEKLFEQVIGNIFESIDGHPRPLRIVYNYPVEHNFLLRTDRVRVIDVVKGHWPKSKPGEAIVTYNVLPSDPTLAREYETLFRPRRRLRKEWLSEYHPGFVLHKPERLGGTVLERPQQPTPGKR